MSIGRPTLKFSALRRFDVGHGIGAPVAIMFSLEEGVRGQQERACQQAHRHGIAEQPQPATQATATILAMPLRPHSVKRSLVGPIAHG